MNHAHRTAIKNNKRRALIVEVSQAILFWIVAMPVAYLFTVIILSL